MQLSVKQQQGGAGIKPQLVRVKQPLSGFVGVTRFLVSSDAEMGSVLRSAEVR